MKITLVTQIFPPEIGGPATYAWEVLKRLTARGHSVKIVTPMEKAETIPNVYIAPKKRLSLKFIRFIYNYFGLLAGILRVTNDSNLIYTLNPAKTGFISLIAAKLMRKPIVLRFVGDAAWERAFDTRQTNKNLEDFLKAPEGGINIKILVILQRFIFKEIDKIIVPSYFLKRILIDCYNVNPDKIKVIYNSVDLKDFDGAKNEESQTLGECVVTVGRLIQHKKIEGIIKAIEKLADEFPDINLLIVGEGPEKTNLEKFSQEIGINSRVKFYGRTTREETIKLIQESDIFVLNSVYEGLPHVVIEAMACQTPVITTNIRGTDEVVKDGKTGLMVTPNNDDELKEKLALLLKNKKLRKRLAKNAYKNVKQKFTWDKNLSLMEEELERMI